MEVTDIQIKELWEKERIAFDYEEKIHEWLSLVPKMDLHGLGRISVVNYSSKLEEKDNRGNWFAKDKGTPAHIELCVERIVESMPETDRKNAEALGARLAFELFRQVGKNSLQMKHGVPTEKQDNYITKYAEKIFTAHFAGWKVKDGVPTRP